MLAPVVASLVWIGTYQRRHGSDLLRKALGVLFPTVILAASCLIAIFKGWWLSLPLPLAALGLVILLTRQRISSEA